MNGLKNKQGQSMGPSFDPRQVDIRLAVGRPSGENPIKILCPLHPDRNPSLCVYRGNLNCLGCGFHVSRRYASLAFLLGYWDGHGDENSDVVRQAVRHIDLKSYVGRGIMKQATRVIPPLDPYAADSFHQYLLRYGPIDRLRRERGLTMETIKRFKLGDAGTHWTLPIYCLNGVLQTIQYRADDRVVDAERKYDGLYGHNSPALYFLPLLHNLSRIDELWVVEGLFDEVASSQAGSVTLTIDRKSTRLNSSHANISYAVFCLKKKIKFVS